MGECDELLVRSTRGDHAAFAEIVRTHQSMVFSIALRFLRHHALAEELAQEVFLHLYRNLASIESEAHLVSWLRKVTCHRCIDATRRRRFRDHESIDDVPEPAALPAAPSDPFLSRTLGRLVASLPDRQRMIVTLRYQEDLEPGEIAELLDLPVNTVKSHLRRSLGLLREKLARCAGAVGL